MDKNSVSVALIPARGGSKGLPGKNMMEINGFPLIYWSIKQALASERISAVYVSTDCEVIASSAQSLGAHVPFLRPAELAADTSTTESVMLHFCGWMRDHDVKADNLVLLQPTSPIRLPKTLTAAVEFFEHHNFDSLVSVSESHRFFWNRNSRGEAVSSYDYKNRPRRQDIKEVERLWVETGSIYISTIEGLIKENNRLFGDIGLFETDECESQEIDTMTDFYICEAIMKGLGWKHA